jgi:hypothetical protein
MTLSPGQRRGPYEPIAMLAAESMPGMGRTKSARVDHVKGKATDICALAAQLRIQLGVDESRESLSPPAFRMSHRCP